MKSCQNVTIYDALQTTGKAWDIITEEPIINCFEKEFFNSGFNI